VARSARAWAAGAIRAAGATGVAGSRGALVGTRAGAHTVATARASTEARGRTEALSEGLALGVHGVADGVDELVPREAFEALYDTGGQQAGVRLEEGLNALCDSLAHGAALGPAPIAHALPHVRARLLEQAIQRAHALSLGRTGFALTGRAGRSTVVSPGEGLLGARTKELQLLQEARRVEQLPLFPCLVADLFERALLLEGALDRELLHELHHGVSALLVGQPFQALELLGPPELRGDLCGQVVASALALTGEE